MTGGSCLYAGSVMHRRLRPRTHHFRYRAFWLLLDLDDLTRCAEGLKWFSHNRPNLFSFYDADHGDGTTTPLRVQVERQLREAGIDVSGGTIRILCMPRTLGYCFNPLSILFCHDNDGRLAAVIHQVHNTFGQRHSYVMTVDGGRDPVLLSCGKRFYVSPFIDMDVRYRFRLAGPHERVSIAISVADRDGPVLNAVLSGRRRPLDDRNLMRLFLVVPAVTLKVTGAIYWQALWLWLKRIGLRHRPPAPPGPITVVSPTRTRSA